MNNLSQFKKAIKEGREFEIINHIRTECIGEIRKPNVIQTNGFYSIVPNDTENKVTKANHGKGSWLNFGKASEWAFDNGLCTCYLSSEHIDKNFVMTIKFIK